MAATTRSKERRSLCEESMLLVVNILKFSSLSLAGKTLILGTSSSAGDPPAPAPKKLAKSYSAVAGPKGTVSRRKAQRAPEGGSKLSYVMLPTASGNDHSASVPTSTAVVHRGSTRGGKKSRRSLTDGDGRFADYIRRFHEKTENEVQNAIVECKASDYIKRFHEKNRKDSNNESRRLPYAVLPPHLHLSPPNSSA